MANLSQEKSPAEIIISHFEVAIGKSIPNPIRYNIQIWLEKELAELKGKKNNDYS